MDPQTIFVRTARGEAALKDPARVPEQALGALLAAIDGRASLVELGAKLNLETGLLERALQRLADDDFIDVVIGRAAPPAENGDLDFTSSAFESERKARTDAEGKVAEARKAREEAQILLDKTRAAHEQAVAKAQTETMARAKAEQNAAAEKKARSAAEDRAKQETVARVMQEHQLRQQAENDIEAKVEAELRARKQAEVDADIRARAEAQQRAEAMAAKVRQEDKADDNEAAAATTAVRKPKSTANWPLRIVVTLVLLPILALVLLHFVPLSGFSGPFERLVAERIQEPVTIGAIGFSLVPYPQLRLEHITIGKAQDVKIGTAIVPVKSFALLDEHKKISEARLVTVSVENDAVTRLGNWVRPQAGQPRLQIDTLKATGVKIVLPNIELANFDAVVHLMADGSLQKATLSDPKWGIDLTPRTPGVTARFSARAWKPPFGPAAEFSQINATAVIAGSQAVVSAIDGRLYGGAFKGDMTVKWGANLSADGSFNLKGVDLGELLPAFTSGFSASGALDANGRFSSTSRAPAELFNNARVGATFLVQRGVINNVDLVRAVQTPSRTGQHGGKTAFAELAGEAQAGGGRISYRNLRLTSGPLSATGTVDVAPNGEIAGRVSISLGTSGRATLAIRGTAQDPVIGE